MGIASQRGRWRWVLSAAFFGGVLSAAIPAQAVILYGPDPGRNTDAPSAADGLAAWNLQWTWGNYLATPIDPTHFIAAKHVGTQSAVITHQGLTYQVDTSVYWDDSGSDLRIYSLQPGYAFSTYAPLYNEDVDGSEQDKTLTVIGRGTQRGDPVYLGGTLKGWEWGTDDRLQSWGLSQVDGFTYYNDSEHDTSILYFFFLSDGAHNSALSVGDSSGAVFIYSQGLWKLAGINWAVWPGGLISTTGEPSDPGAYASIFDDATGLYQKDGAGNWVLISEPGYYLPGVSLASRISDRFDWIQSVAPGVTVPEPGTMVLLGFGGLALLFGAWLRRRRSP